MDFNLTREQREIKMAAREFAEGEFRDVARECDREEKTNLEVMKKASELGFVGLFIDEKYGGGGYGYLENALVTEEFWRVDPGLAGSTLCACFGTEMILLFGTEAQKERYLTAICGGSATSAVAATEPDAGSDVLSVSTRAEKRDDGYVVNGSKMFISNGNIADFFITLCLTHPDAEDRHQRHSVFIINADSPGITRNKIKGKLGIRAHDTAEIFFN
ncbi:MAG TPA: acyl-CoA dehydrogenase family protein, partial [Desulfobacteria bacterium]|nr:acyl-CoA dehydrogenase family protein [Desulfobacteria bacterium]